MNGTLCGQSDPPLNEAGRAQVRALLPMLRPWNVRRLYASDLRRAVQTAEPLAELWNISIARRSALREISFGDWEGRKWSQLRADEPDIRAMETAGELCAPGGETFACFRDRVLQGLKETVFECNGELAAIVTHLGVMRVVLKELGSADCVWEPHQRMDPCSIYRIRVPDSFLVTSPSTQPIPAQSVENGWKKCNKMASEPSS
jgi:broad specificity phosphatase PhoE